MSQAGRYAHEQNTKRHAQRKGAAKRAPIETIETATWMQDAMAVSRAMARAEDNLWGIAEWALYSAVGYDEAERRLRRLCALGFLKMSVERRDGKFLRYTFSMVDVNLPQ